ncbi:hypothetical protein [Polymorphobacter sp.]|uniref:hypothetical protein n=1 Tax=Polymorphobacter sp. TaxID=1909290 RepID=UPI003F728883
MKALAAAALMAALPAAAQTSPDSAIALVNDWLDAHNAHDLAATIAFYDADATFQLNQGRPLVSGRAAIAELERFDAIAGSVLMPWGLAATHTGDTWSVTARGVIEHSRIFAATGLAIVIAVPEAPIFVLKGGRIVHATQPPLQPACTAAIVEAFTGMAKWLETSRSPIAWALLKDGRLQLTPERLPLIADQITAWRQASGWAPPPIQMRACGTPPA